MTPKRLADFSDDELMRELASRVKVTSSLRAGSSNLVYASFDIVFDAFQALGYALIDAFTSAVRYTARRLELFLMALFRRLFSEEL